MRLGIADPSAHVTETSRFKATDEALTEIAKSAINQQAEAA